MTKLNKFYLKEPRLIRLALKYAYIWKSRCEGLRHRAGSSPCSVHHAVVRAFDGNVEILWGDQLPRLKVGVQPYGNGRVHARVRELPPSLPPDLFFVPLDIPTYLGTDVTDFAALLFTAPSRVYVLLPTLMREPRWLRDLFVKARDPVTGNHLAVQASWHFNSSFALLLATGMKYQAFVQQRFMVWESIKVYGADEELVLGGPGLAEMGDTLFIIATRAIRDGADGYPSVRNLLGAFSRGQLTPAPSRFFQPLILSHDGTAGVAGGMDSELRTAAPPKAATPEPYVPDGSLRGVALGTGAGPSLRDADPESGRDQRTLQLFVRRMGAGRAPEGTSDSGAGGAAGYGGGGFPGTVVSSGTGWLLQRFVKAVKRDRVQDLRALLQSDAWRRYCMSPDEVSFLPPTERYPLTVDLAVANMSVPVLVELVDGAGCHLNYRALKLLVIQWDRLADLVPGGGEGLLLRYLVRQPNPLSVVGAFLLAMRAEVAGGRNHSTALQDAIPRFKAVQLELLRQIQDSYFRVSEEARLEAGMPLLEDILEQPQAIQNAPRKDGAGGSAAGPLSAPAPPLVLSDYSPLRLAFRDHDTQFMSAQLIDAYTRRLWLGPEYVALNILDGHNRLSGLDPLFVYTIVENLGFVGDAGSYSMQLTFRLWHLITMTSAAFFRSPRGRWAMKFMSNFSFLAMFMIVLSTYVEVRMPANKGGGTWRAVHTVFLVFTGGNLLEAAEVMAMRYRNSAGRYFMSAPGEVLGILVDVGVFAAIMPCLVTAYTDSAAAEAAARHGLPPPPSDLSPAQLSVLHMALSTLAIFVWIRSLLVMVPLYRKLGPLTRTMTRMGGEILAFVPLYVAVTLGFAAAFHSTIGKSVDSYGTFALSVLHLFEATLGTFNYDELDILDERTRLYSVILLTVYLVLAALLLTNLLIAIISYKYRPEEVRAESTFDLAEMVDRYRFQVKHHLICSPFNLLLLVFAWLPAADLPKLPPYEWFKYGMTPLDGMTFATPGFPTTPGGRHEIPHLCYLLTLYPLLIVFANVLYFLHTPYAVLYWSFTGHRKLLRELLGNSSGPGGSDGPGAGGPGGAPGDVSFKSPGGTDRRAPPPAAFVLSASVQRWWRSRTQPLAAASASATSPGGPPVFRMSTRQQLTRPAEPSSTLKPDAAPPEGSPFGKPGQPQPQDQYQQPQRVTPSSTPLPPRPPLPPSKRPSALRELRIPSPAATEAAAPAAEALSESTRVPAAFDASNPSGYLHGNNAQGVTSSASSRAIALHVLANTAADSGANGATVLRSPLARSEASRGSAGWIGQPIRAPVAAADESLPASSGFPSARSNAAGSGMEIEAGSAAIALRSGPSLRNVSGAGAAGLSSSGETALRLPPSVSSSPPATQRQSQAQLAQPPPALMSRVLPGPVAESTLELPSLRDPQPAGSGLGACKASRTAPALPASGGQDGCGLRDSESEDELTTVGPGSPGPVAEGTQETSRRRITLGLLRLGGGGGGAEGGGGASGAEREAMAAPSPYVRRAPSQNAFGGAAHTGGGLRAKSLRSMHTYATSRDTYGSSGRNLSAHLEEFNLYDDLSDAVNIQPPYMKLLRLLTLTGLRDAAVSTVLLIVLIVAATVLYVLLMGVLAGLLCCCIVPWVGSLAVSLMRILYGAWRGLQNDDTWSFLGDSRATATTPTAPKDGATAAGGEANAAISSTPKGRWVDIARGVRRRAVRCSYLTKSQIEAAISAAYGSPATPASCNPTVAASGGDGGGGGGGGSNLAWGAANGPSRVALLRSVPPTGPVAKTSPTSGAGGPSGSQTGAAQGANGAADGGQMGAEYRISALSAVVVGSDGQSAVSSTLVGRMADPADAGKISAVEPTPGSAGQWMPRRKLLEGAASASERFIASAPLPRVGAAGGAGVGPAAVAESVTVAMAAAAAAPLGSITPMVPASPRHLARASQQNLNLLDIERHSSEPDEELDGVDAAAAAAAAKDPSSSSNASGGINGSGDGGGWAKCDSAYRPSRNGTAGSFIRPQAVPQPLGGRSAGSGSASISPSLTSLLRTSRRRPTQQQSQARTHSYNGANDMAAGGEAGSDPFDAAAGCSNGGNAVAGYSSSTLYVNCAPHRLQPSPLLLSRPSASSVGPQHDHGSASRRGSRSGLGAPSPLAGKPSTGCGALGAIVPYSGDGADVNAVLPYRDGLASNAGPICIPGAIGSVAGTPAGGVAGAAGGAALGPAGGSERLHEQLSGLQMQVWQLTALVQNLTAVAGSDAFARAVAEADRSMRPDPPEPIQR